MQKLSSYIGPDLQKKAKLLHRLTLSIRMQLPVDLARNCWVASIDDRTLTIITNDPCRASQIRFQQREILKLLNHELNPTVNEYLKRIKIKIGNVSSGTEAPTKAQSLSHYSAKRISECSNNIKDLELKSALSKLAKRCPNS